MQKTFLKFLVYELVERLARFDNLLNELAENPGKVSPNLTAALRQQSEELQQAILAEQALINRLFSENALPKEAELSGALERLVYGPYQTLQELSRVLNQLLRAEPSSETQLFTQEALPAELLRPLGDYTLILGDEDTAATGAPLDGILLDRLSVLQKNNPLAWVSVARTVAARLAETAGPLKTLAEKQKGVLADTGLFRSLAAHALNLRLFGPAYYFMSVSEAVLQRDTTFLQVIEPALFYGLNHLNFINKSLVILHEASEPALTLLGAAASGSKSAKQALAENQVAEIFRTVEKLIPTRLAFTEKNFQRAQQLQQRLEQGILLSGNALYPIDEVGEALAEQRQGEAFSIYDVLTMITEYPYSPREIVNAGWLHKMERSPVWLYSVVLGESAEENEPGGFACLGQMLDYQDHLLQKSIETSEVHRVLLCTP